MYRLRVHRAFVEAFPPDSGAVLVLKSSQAERDPIGRERVRAAAAPHPHVVLVEGYLSPADTHALIAAWPTASCRCTAPRASGSRPAEAMAIGKPVIATGYSGNLDFMTDANAYLVDYTLARGRARVLAVSGEGPLGGGRPRARRAPDARGLRRSAGGARARRGGGGVGRGDAFARARRAGRCACGSSTSSRAARASRSCRSPSSR